MYEPKGATYSLTSILKLGSSNSLQNKNFSILHLALLPYSTIQVSSIKPALIGILATILGSTKHSIAPVSIRIEIGYPKKCTSHLYRSGLIICLSMINYSMNMVLRWKVLSVRSMWTLKDKMVTATYKASCPRASPFIIHVLIIPVVSIPYISIYVVLILVSVPISLVLISVRICLILILHVLDLLLSISLLSVILITPIIWIKLVILELSFIVLVGGFI